MSEDIAQGKVLVNNDQSQPLAWLDRRLGLVNVEQAWYVLFIVLAIASRFAMLGLRVMSHDESLHTRYSWELYDGQGFSHTPLMHGPLGFHLTALSYWLLGDSDATARVPVAILGVVLVAFPYLLRQRLGRVAALCTSFLLLISPSLLYYSRYIRWDVPIIVWSMVAVASLWAYVRQRQDKYLYWFAAGLSLMFATKEVAFIYVAILGSFLVLRLVPGLLSVPWSQPRARVWFQIGLVMILVGALVFAGGLFAQGLAKRAAQQAALDPAATAVDAAAATKPGEEGRVIQIIGGAIGGLGIALAILTALLGATSGLRQFPEFDLIILCGTLLLPFLAPVPIKLLGSDPLDYTFSWSALTQAGAAPILGWTYLVLVPLLLFAWYWLQGRAWRSTMTWAAAAYGLTVPIVMIWTVLGFAPLPEAGVFRSAAVLIPIILLTVVVGLWWDWRRWLNAAGIFYVIFFFLFTTIFTNGQGIATGWIGSLGYWLEQQEVKRGGQPGYFYLFVVPIYEFLPIMGTVAAGILWAWRDKGLALVGRLFAQRWQLDEQERDQLFGFIPFALWWAVLTWALYSYSGEKMGWLTTHFAVPMIILAGWFLGRLIGSLPSTEWIRLWKRGGWALAILLPLLVAALVRGGAPILAGQFRPGEQQLDSLIVTGRVLAGLVVAAGALYALVRLVPRLSPREVLKTLAVVAFAFLALLTVRAAWMASYIHFDDAREFLVYAHGGRGTKIVMEQIEDISLRLYGDPSIRVSFDDDTSWPFWWYLRDYPNKVYYGANPSRDSMDVPVAVVGDKNWAKVEPYAGNRFYTFEYSFVQWPMEDYKNLTWERIWGALIDPAMRAALWDILVNRDYTRYAQATGRSFSLGTWPLRHQFRFYVRKDIAAQLWDYGVGPAVVEAAPLDPYEQTFQADLLPLRVIDRTGTGEGLLQAPRDVALGPDGLVYVADSGLHRVQVYDATGRYVRGWGSLCDLPAGGAGCEDPDGSGPLPLGAGQFKEPWGVAVGPDGTVYVADTWNHRVQVFTADGLFVRAWGTLGQVPSGQSAGALGYFYGPRDLALGPTGLLYVTDTGNKRIQVYEAGGRYIGEFGDGGPLEGQLDEPVGLAFGPDGLLYVADTWNGRVQVFDQNHTFVRQWTVDAWYGQSVNNKPYLAVDAAGLVYLTDPEMARVLVFDSDGVYRRGFGQYSEQADGFGLPTGIAVDDKGLVYVTDAANGRVLVYLPAQS